MSIRPSDVQPASAPIDLSRGWLNIVRRIKSVGRGQQGVALVKVIVLVDEQGEPQMWTAPTMTLLEPKLKVEDLLKKLSPEQMAQVLQTIGEES